MALVKPSKTEKEEWEVMPEVVSDPVNFRMYRYESVARKKKGRAGWRMCMCLCVALAGNGPLCCCRWLPDEISCDEDVASHNHLCVMHRLSRVACGSGFRFTTRCGCGRAPAWISLA